MQNCVNPSGPWKCLARPDMEQIRRAQSWNGSEGCASERRRRLRRIQVSFDSVQVRSFEQTLGDNPTVSIGPPVQLGWDFEQREPVQVDIYESNKVLARRRPHEFALNHFQRRNLLQFYCGIRKEEIERAQKEADKCKFQRLITRLFLPTMKIEDFVQSAGRKVKRLFRKQHR